MTSQLQLSNQSPVTHSQMLKGVFVHPDLIRPTPLRSAIKCSGVTRGFANTPPMILGEAHLLQRRSATGQSCASPVVNRMAAWSCLDARVRFRVDLAWRPPCSPAYEVIGMNHPESFACWRGSDRMAFAITRCAKILVLRKGLAV